MSEQYLLPMARNLVTGMTIKSQDLYNVRYTVKQRDLAEDMARQIAAKMTVRTNQPWEGFVKLYTPRARL